MFSFWLKKRRIDTHVIINASKHSERYKLFGEDGDLGALFFNHVTFAFADNINQLSQLQEALMLINDQGLTTDLSFSVPMKPIDVSTSVPKAQINPMVIIPEVVETTI